MKKQYICPKTRVVTINAAKHILAGSATGTDIHGSASSSYDVLSRESSDWDEE